VQVPQTLHQRLRHGRQARTDFDHRLTGLWRDGFDDAIDDGAVG